MVRSLSRYRILRTLGEGGMSRVVLAYDKESCRLVAIKFLAEALRDSPSYVDRFLREGKMGYLLSQPFPHPNLVTGYDAGWDPDADALFFAMEFINGPTAEERLDHEKRIPLDEAVRIVLDIARALEYLHFKKFVHRDIKPGNILLAPNGVAKLADLGVALPKDTTGSLTSSDQGIGTLYYMPWEQMLNSSIVDERSDIFALGATFYHLITGEVPFPGVDEEEIGRAKNLGEYIPASEHIPELPEEVDMILAKMLARDPRDRFRYATDLIDALSASGRGREGSGPPVPDTIADESRIAKTPTRADLKPADMIDTPIVAARQQMWVLKFRRPDDRKWRKARGCTQHIIHWFKEGLLPDDCFASRESSNNFRRLTAYPEFNELTSRPPDAPTKEAAKLRTPDAPAKAPDPEPQWKFHLEALYIAGVVVGLLCCSAGALLLRMLVTRH